MKKKYLKQKFVVINVLKYALLYDSGTNMSSFNNYEVKPKKRTLMF